MHLAGCVVGAIQSHPRHCVYDALCRGGPILLMRAENGPSDVLCTREYQAISMRYIPVFNDISLSAYRLIAVEMVFIPGCFVLGCKARVARAACSGKIAILS